MSEYQVKYGKISSPTSFRKLPIGSSLSYEDILMEFVIDKICDNVYGCDYDYFMNGEHVFFHRKNANDFICEYEMVLTDMNKRDKVLFVYQIVIECIENDGEVDLLESFQEEFKFK